MFRTQTKGPRVTPRASARFVLISLRYSCPLTNAMAESFFASLETELIDRSSWRTRAEARADVFGYIEVFYNRIRRHSAIGYLSPAQFEDRYRSVQAVEAV